MARPINAGFTPAQIIQQYQYYQYPIQQLITAYGAKEEQQQKAIDSLDTYDSELGKYTALPGEVEKRDAVIKQYNTLKDITADQDLTGRTGRKAITEFKSQLTGSIFPKLTAYDASAKAFKENYKQEADKLAKGEGSPLTLRRLNDMAKAWDSDNQGTFQGLNRGKFMEYSQYMKEYQPELLKGGWDPTTLGYKQLFMSTPYEKVYEQAALKGIKREDLSKSVEAYKEYLRSQGYLEDIQYNLSANITPDEFETEFVSAAYAQLEDKLRVAQNESKSYKADNKEHVLDVATYLGLSEEDAKQFIAKKGKDDAFNTTIRQKLFDATNNKLSQLSKEERVLGGMNKYTSDYILSQAAPFIEIYSGRITDIDSKTVSIEDFALKEALRRQTALAAAAAANYKDPENKPMSLYEGEYEISSDQMSNYVTEGYNDFSSWMNLSREVARLEQNKNLTPQQQLDLNRKKDRLNSLEPVAKEYSDNILSKIAVNERTAKDVLSELMMTAEAQSVSVTKDLGPNIARLYTGSDRYTSLNNLIDGLYKLADKVPALKQKIDDKINNPTTGLIATYSKGDNIKNIATTRRSTIIGNTPALKGFVDNLSTVTKGNEVIPIAAKQKEDLKITTKGDVLAVKDGKLTVIGTLNSADKINLAKALEKTIASESAETQTPAIEQTNLNTLVNLKAPTLQKVVTGLITSDKKGVKSLVHKDSKNEYYVEVDKTTNLLTAYFKPIGSNSYKLLFGGNTATESLAFSSFEDSDAFIRSFYDEILQKQ